MNRASFLAAVVELIWPKGGCSAAGVLGKQLPGLLSTKHPEDGNAARRRLRGDLKHRSLLLSLSVESREIMRAL